jgi:AraC family transcriptional regulator, exoenzyme S synthesis regulatory protein ExsA
MEFKTTYITPEIKLSTYEGKSFNSEVIFEHHLLVWLISGETKLVQADISHVLGAGDIFFIPRHQLATAIMYPANGLPFKAVAMHLGFERLKNFYAQLDTKVPAIYDGKLRRFSGHPLLQSFLASLVPYFNMQDSFPAEIGSLKINEAISILRVIDPSIDAVLTHFSEPGKIDLSAFMEKNFMFNMPMEKFGYLTGRSLSTFNRDFKRTFNTTPQKWLTQKRLALAYFQLAEKKKRPSDVYLEVGFEDLSHFSSAFKKQYGYAPTSLLKN